MQRLRRKCRRVLRVGSRKPVNHNHICNRCVANTGAHGADETPQTVGGQYFARRIARGVLSAKRSSVGECQERPPAPPRFQCCAQAASRVRACKTFVHFEASARGLFFNIEIGGCGGAAPPARHSQPRVLEILLAKYCPCSVASMPMFAVTPEALPSSTPSSLQRGGPVLHHDRKMFFLPSREDGFSSHIQT